MPKLEKGSAIADKQALYKRATLLSQELSERTREFCHHVLTCDTIRAAAIEAGYSRHTAAQAASRLMKDPRVEEYIEVLMSMREVASAITDKDIISLQMSTYEAAMVKEDYKAANTALDQLAKMTGVYTKVGGSKGGSPRGDAAGAKQLDRTEKAQMLELIDSVRQRENTQLD